MAKEMKTGKEFADLVMREARASGECTDLQSLYVTGSGPGQTALISYRVLVE